MSTPVYVLGAGFSRAISDSMPVTDELGNAVLERDAELRKEVGSAGFSGGDFETWLSRKAEDQPYLSSSENLRSRALYSRAVDLVAQVLVERQNEALAWPAPEWLLHLVEMWHFQRAIVITFNYDTLVEAAVKAARLPDAETNVLVPWPTVINFTPTGRADLSLAEGGQSANWSSFRLLKMHGSLNWLWVPGDNSGATISRSKLPGIFGTPDPLSEEERRRWFPGREPFLVPPAALKSGYYANPVTREIWRQAFEAFRDSRRVTFLGYSLPATDLSVSGMIKDAMDGPRQIDVMDLNPRPILERLAALRPDVTSDSISGPIAIQEYAIEERSQLLAPVAKKITEASAAHSDLNVAVSWDEGAIAAALRADRVGDQCVVHLEGIGQIWFATRTDRLSRPDVPGHSTDAPLTSKELHDVVKGCKSIAVVTANGETLAVFDYFVRDFTGRNGGEGEWLQLVCCGGGVSGLG